MDPMSFFKISVNRTTYLQFLNGTFNDTNYTNVTQSSLRSGFSFTNLSATGFDLTAI